MTDCGHVHEKNGIRYGCPRPATARLIFRENWGKHFGIGEVYLHRCESHTDEAVRPQRVEAI